MKTVSSFGMAGAAFACAVISACGGAPEGGSHPADAGADGWRLPDVGTGGHDAGASGDAGPADALLPADTSETGDGPDEDGGGADAGGASDAGDLSDSGSGADGDTLDADTPDVGGSDAAGAEDAASTDNGTSDAGSGDGGLPDTGVVFEETPVNVPQGFLCDIPPDYITNGGDPTYITCDLAADRFSDRDPSDVPALLRIVAWNIEFGADYAAVLDALQNRPELSGADFLLLSEVARANLQSNPQNLDVARELATALAMNYVFAVEWDRREVPDELGEHGIAVLSKFPLGNATAIRHVPLNDWYAEDKLYGGRVTLGVDALVGGGLIRVYASHLDTRGLGGAGRAEQAAEIRADADLPGRPAIQVVGGDLNTWTCNYIIADCTKPPQAEQTVQDFLAAGWKDGCEGWNSWTQLGKGFYPQRLDWIFYRGASGVSGNADQDAKGSDHVPVFFDLQIP